MVFEIGDEALKSPVNKSLNEEDNIYATPDQEWTEAAIGYCEAVESVVFDILGDEENKGKKQKISEDVPSFKLLSSQDSEDSPKNKASTTETVKFVETKKANIDIDKKQKLKKVVDDLEKPKRQIKISEYDKSPWLVRAVDIDKNLSKEEKMIWDYILEGAVRSE